MKSAHAAAVLVIAALATAVAHQGSSAKGHWPGWRGAQRDGVSRETGLLASWPPGGPPRLWTAKGMGAGFSSVSVSDGRVFTVGDRSDGQYVVAVDDTTGKTLWATRVGGIHEDGERGGSRSTPSVEGVSLWVVSTDGDLLCLDATNGAVKWRRELRRDFGARMMSIGGFSESPLIDGDRVVVTPGGPQAAMVALDKLTGKEVWRAKAMPRLGPVGVDGAGYSSVVVSNGGGVKQYVQLMGRGLVSFRASDGAALWGYNRLANTIANIATPVIQDDYVFASTGYDVGAVLLQLSAASGERVNAKERYFLEPGTLQNHHGGFVLIDGHVYGGHGQNQGFPFSVDLLTGKNTWERVRGAGTGSAAVTAAEGLLYFRYENGVMALIEASPQRYVLRSSFQIPGVTRPSWSHPVIAGGRLYLREQDLLHAYNIKR